MLNLALIAASALVLQTGQLPKPVAYIDYDSCWGLDLAQAAAFDGTAIVKVVTGLVDNSSFPLRLSQRGIVVSAPSIPRGTAVRMVVDEHMDPSNPDQPGYEMEVGERYLVIGLRSKAGSLPIANAPFSLDSEGNLRTSGRLPLKTPNEIFAVNVFHTTSSQLNAAPTGAMSLMEALVDCMKGESQDETVRMNKFIKHMRPPGMEFRFFTSYDDSPLTKKIRQIADAYPPYQRAMLYEILIEWKVRETEKPFVQALMGAIGNPAAYADPRTILGYSYDLDFARGRTLESHVYRPPANTFFDTLCASKSDPILHFLAQRVGYEGKPDATHIQKLAKYLLSKGISVSAQEDVASELSTVYWRKDLGPVVEEVRGSHTWLNREKCLNFWKDAVKSNLILTGKIARGS